MTEKIKPDVLDQIQPFSGMPVSNSTADIIAQGGTLQQVKTEYTTAIAVQIKRSFTNVVKTIKQEAQLAGSSFYYRWDVTTKKGKKVPVQGGSIDLAMSFARNFGNCVTGVDLINETASHFYLKGSFVDLETGFTVTRMFRQNKGVDMGDYDADRKQDMTFQIGQSKAQRNAILQAMPGWLVEECIEIARAAEINKIKPENLATARAGAIDFYEKHGIDQERIEAKLKKKADKWTSKDIVGLKESATGLKEGRVSADELFPPLESYSKEKTKPPAEKPAEKKKAKPKEKPEKKDPPDKQQEEPPPVGATEKPAEEPAQILDGSEAPDSVDDVNGSLADIQKTDAEGFEKALEACGIESIPIGKVGKSELLQAYVKIKSEE